MTLLVTVWSKQGCSNDEEGDRVTQVAARDPVDRLCPFLDHVIPESPNQPYDMKVGTRPLLSLLPHGGSGYPAPLLSPHACKICVRTAE